MTETNSRHALDRSELRLDLWHKKLACDWKRRSKPERNGCSGRRLRQRELRADPRATSQKRIRKAINYHADVAPNLRRGSVIYGCRCYVMAQLRGCLGCLCLVSRHRRLSRLPDVAGICVHRRRWLAMPFRLLDASCLRFWQCRWASPAAQPHRTALRVARRGRRRLSHEHPARHEPPPPRSSSDPETLS